MSDRWDPDSYADGSGVQTREGARFAATIRDLHGARLLDVGCGDGRLTAQLAAAGADVVGIDRSPDMAAAALRLGICAVAGDVRWLPFRDATFDVVYSNATLHWAADHGRVISELSRVLRAGGRLHVRTGGPGNQWRCFVAAERLFASPPYAGFRPAGFHAPLQMADPGRWMAGLREAGLEVRRLDLEEMPGDWESPTAMERWLTAIGHCYTRHLPDDLARRFVAEVVETVWELGPAARTFVRLVVEAQRPTQRPR